MTWALVVVGGAAVVGAVASSEASKRAAKSVKGASQAGISAQERALQTFREGTQPFADIGLAAAPELAKLLGLDFANPEIARIEKQLEGLNAQLPTTSGLPVENIASREFVGPEQFPEQAEQLSSEPKKRKKSLFDKIKGTVIGKEAHIFGLTGGLNKDPITKALAIDPAKATNKAVKGLFSGENEDQARALTPAEIISLESQRSDLQAQLQGLRDTDSARPAATGLSQLEEINPLVSFLRDEGFDQIQESAAGRGRLGSGGTLKDLTKFNTNLASTIVPQLQNQKFNQLFNLLGLGANAATGQGTAALNTATNTSNLLGNTGQAGAVDAQNQGQLIGKLSETGAGIFGAAQGGAFTPPPQDPRFSQVNSGSSFRGLV